MFQSILIILGLIIFEIVSSLDNAVVNADVLATISKKWRRWFLFWGLLTSVFLVRGALPWIIVWCTNPSLGPWGALTASFSGDPETARVLKESSPILLIGGGVFLLFLFFHWLFLEPKHFGLPTEKFFNRQGGWFYAIVSVGLTVIIWYALKQDPMMAFAASIGASIFFITHGFKEHAARIEAEMKTKTDLSDISKLMYLEVLDASFSIDGVIGAFAFTMSVPLILLGNGIGAFVVRELTIRGVDQIRHYPYLKNGAMYSIFFLSVVMLWNGFGHHLPEYIAPLFTILIIGYFFYKSFKHKIPQAETKNNGPKNS